MTENYRTIENLGLSEKLLGRTRFYLEADPSIVETVRKGVIFLMAYWSGPARAAFADLKRAMDAVDPDGQVELVVLDVDGCESLARLPQFKNKFHGAGETAWVQNGKIVGVLQGGTLKDLKRCCLQLLEPGSQF